MSAVPFPKTNEFCCCTLNFWACFGFGLCPVPVSTDTGPNLDDRKLRKDISSAVTILFESRNCSKNGHVRVSRLGRRVISRAAIMPRRRNPQ